MNSVNNVTVFEVTGFPALILIVALAFLAYGWPAILVARRTGKSVWAAALMSIPLVSIVVIWVFALSRWPKVDEEGRN